MKIMNMSIWLVVTSNKLFMRGPSTKIKISKT